MFKIELRKIITKKKFKSKKGIFALLLIIAILTVTAVL
ncbi:unnamed protein product, partial [marine sediment metagenome]